MSDKNQTIRLLCNVFADAANRNAQSLNARDIALRLDPGEFVVTFFHQGVCDPRLAGRDNMRMVRIPRRLGSFIMAREMLWGKHDVLFYPNIYRADELFLRLRCLGRSIAVVQSVEMSAEQIAAYERRRRDRYLRSYRTADVLCGITPYIAESMRSAYGISMREVPIGVDVRSFAPVDRSGRSGLVKALFVGSLQPRKRVSMLLDLARDLRHLPLEVHLAGGGLDASAYARELHDRCRHERLDRVIMHGSVSQERIRDLMAEADFLVLPSVHEGMPKVTIEAAASGLPCVVFDAYHTPSVVDGSTGFQVPDESAFVQACVRLVTDGALRLRMGAAACAHARSWDWDLVAPRWAQVFREAAAAGCAD